MIYRSKEASLQDKAQLITSSFSGMDSLDVDMTGQVMSVLGELNVARVIITDGEGKALYDSLAQRSAKWEHLGYRR